MHARPRASGWIINGTWLCNNYAVTRTYRLGKRAERAEGTRQRIAEAALELHGEIGPARTTVSAIAARAGVQRHTYYAHFPDERAINLACSGLHIERSPLPDPESWVAIADPIERLRLGLTELYGYYAEHERLLANVLRDAEADPVLHEITELRIGQTVDRIASVLAEPFSRGERNDGELTAAIALALDFNTWRTLVRRGDLTNERAAELAARLVG